MAKNPLKKKIGICNIIIVILCLASILGYFIMPFWKVEVSYSLTSETMQELMGDMLGGSDSDSGDNGDNDESGMKKALASNESNVDEGDTDSNLDTNSDSDSDSDSDSASTQAPSSSSGISSSLLDEDQMGALIDEVLGENGITLSVSLELKSADILGSLSGDAEESVETMVGGIIDGLVDTVYEPVTEIVKNVAKAVTKQAVTTAVRTEVENLLEEVVDGEVDEILQQAGITEEYINEEIDALMTKLENGVTPSEISQDLVNTAKDAMEKLQTVEGFEDAQLDAEDEEELRSAIEEVLTEMTNENGEIVLDEMFADILLKVINEGENGENGENQGNVAVSPVSVTYLNSADGANQQSSTEQLKAEIRTLIMDAIGADAETIEMIALVMQILSYVMLFTFFTWFYLILKIVVKLGAKNNAIKLKLPILLGWLPCLVLVLAPTIALSLLTNESFLTGTIGMSATEVANITSILGGFSIKFISGSIVSFVVAVVLFFFVLFYYGRLRRKLRKQIKAAKKAAKRAKKLGYALPDENGNNV